MQIDENRLMEVFATCWEEEKEIDEIRESVKNSLESFCEECEAPKKIINAAYTHYKKVASGKVKPDENDAISELNAIIDKNISSI